MLRTIRTLTLVLGFAFTLAACGKEALYPRGDSDDLRLVAATAPASGSVNSSETVRRYVYDEEGRIAESFNSNTLYSGFDFIDDLAGQFSRLDYTLYVWDGAQLVSVRRYSFDRDISYDEGAVDLSKARSSDEMRYGSYVDGRPDSVFQFDFRVTPVAEPDRRCGLSYDDRGRLVERRCVGTDPFSGDPDYDRSDHWTYDPVGNITLTYQTTPAAPLPINSVIYEHSAELRDPNSFARIPNFHSPISQNLLTGVNGVSFGIEAIFHDEVVLGLARDGQVTNTFIYEK